MGSVYKALDTRTGADVAIKRVRIEGAELDERAVRREIDICTRLQEIPNDHLLAVKTISCHPGSYALVTEFAKGGMLTGKTAKDAVQALPPAWKERLQPCIDVVPESRPDASVVKDQPARIAC